MTDEYEYRKRLDEEEYTEFIKSALDKGFTDSQADWLWENCRNCTSNLYTG